jgi:DNA-3-methyladenine glycosylase I
VKSRSIKKRCGWCTDDPVYIAYHDREWGNPVHNDRKLFEFLILEGAQAGLSWLTILKKRDNYRVTFDQFDFCKIAHYNERKIQSLLNNPGIVRNKLKVRGAVRNARAFLKIRENYGTFNKYIWSFVNGEPVQNCWTKLKNVPTKTKLSDTVSKDLEQRGFTFVGSTICYAFMQAVGLINDHTVDCFRHSECKKNTRND